MEIAVKPKIGTPVFAISFGRESVNAGALTTATGGVRICVVERFTLPRAKILPLRKVVAPNEISPTDIYVPM